MRIAAARGTLSSLSGSGAIEPMLQVEIAKAVQLLDLMLEFFADDGHWTPVLLRCGLRRIQLAVPLLDPSGAEMALHHDPDMVRAIVGARQVKFLFGPAGSQGQDTLA
jgi:hypothetical protein